MRPRAKDLDRLLDKDLVNLQDKHLDKGLDRRLDKPLDMHPDKLLDNHQPLDKVLASHPVKPQALDMHLVAAITAAVVVIAEVAVTVEVDVYVMVTAAVATAANLTNLEVAIAAAEADDVVTAAVAKASKVDKANKAVLEESVSADLAAEEEKAKTKAAESIVDVEAEDTADPESRAAVALEAERATVRIPDVSHRTTVFMMLFSSAGRCNCEAVCKDRGSGSGSGSGAGGSGSGSGVTVITEAPKVVVVTEPVITIVQGQALPPGNVVKQDGDVIVIQQTVPAPAKAKREVLLEPEDDFSSSLIRLIRDNNGNGRGHGYGREKPKGGRCRECCGCAGSGRGSGHGSGRRRHSGDGGSGLKTSVATQPPQTEVVVVEEARRKRASQLRKFLWPF